ncbi:MAG: hypothetical protein HOV81_42850 [Kofleriaceae bacterium]|nr:hypothetical protein [Kofleriaceae bacterium]
MAVGLVRLADQAPASETNTVGVGCQIHARKMFARVPFRPHAHECAVSIEELRLLDALTAGFLVAI